MTKKVAVGLRVQHEERSFITVAASGWSEEETEAVSFLGVDWGCRPFDDRLFLRLALLASPLQGRPC